MSQKFVEKLRKVGRSPRLLGAVTAAAAPVLFHLECVAGAGPWVRGRGRPAHNEIRHELTRLVVHQGPPEQSEEQEFPMNTRFCRSFAILALASVTLYADVTTRYKTEVTINPALQALAKGVDLPAPPETEFRLKGGKGFSSSMGFTSIVDLTTKQMTVLDAATMRYAKTTSEQFMDEAARALPEIPAGARAAMAAMKTSVSSTRLTGRSAVIQGVEAEER